jgi:hypothetical protein
MAVGSFSRHESHQYDTIQLFVTLLLPSTVTLMKNWIQRKQQHLVRKKEDIDSAPHASHHHAVTVIQTKDFAMFKFKILYLYKLNGIKRSIEIILNFKMFTSRNDQVFQLVNRL